MLELHSSKTPTWGGRKRPRRPPRHCSVMFLRKALLQMMAAAALLVMSRGPGGASVVLAKPTADSSTSTVLRIRMPDGTMQRLQVSPHAVQTQPLSAILAPLMRDMTDDDVAIHCNSNCVSGDETMSTLGLTNGSLLALRSTSVAAKQKLLKKYAKPKQQPSTWHPFPDLAKDYDAAQRQLKQSTTDGRASFGGLQTLQSAMHVVDPQPSGALFRVTMCAVSAGTLQAHCVHHNKLHHRVALLLGTINRERKELKKKARTSLSSTTPDDEFCQVAKVQAVWEPTSQKGTTASYDREALLHGIPANVQRVADNLGLLPVGWLFTYDDEKDQRHAEEGLPVCGVDVQQGGQLQVINMQVRGRQDGAQFCTLAMDARTGTTEAFQLSDVSVQMVAQDELLVSGIPPDVPTPKKNTKSTGTSRFVPTLHPVLMDGKESSLLDVVLFLVNTAMLSHTGQYANQQGRIKKSSGQLTTKFRKQLVSLLAQNDDAKFLEAIADFAVLLALDTLLTTAESAALCTSVKKFARGLKKSTSLNNQLKDKLRAVLEI